MTENAISGRYRVRKLHYFILQPVLSGNAQTQMLNVSYYKKPHNEMYN